jgi:hypothetical protein
MKITSHVVVVGAVLFVSVAARAQSASPESRLKGRFVFNNATVCSYTTTPGGATASNTQSQGTTGTITYDGAGHVTNEFVSNNFNVPAGTRNTSVGSCSGTYSVDADGIVTSDVACESTTVDGAGTGNASYVPSIKNRRLMIGDTLHALPKGAPAEETVIITPAGSSTTVTQYRKCSRLGVAQKIPGQP